ncbi:PucR family transcriptional regulator ligand-binding domain-containing protein [Leucobacter sp. HNU]|uniref:PucR family transcriptional regulator ligand-binding domain-containing protein n=1 Tax=Leucobacter sp. HNU TaxID=3236805 RepID=UPI003A802B58
MPITAPVAAPTVHATIELGELLRQYQLGLVLIAGTADDAGERPVQWVHGSDLADPSPFLTPRTVLLTTGAQFPAPPTQAQADEYVDRLIAAGATALGVAAGVVWDRTPATLVAACDRRGFPWSASPTTLRSSRSCRPRPSCSRRKPAPATSGRSTPNERSPPRPSRRTASPRRSARPRPASAAAWR